ncbi:stability protein StbD [Haemophilus haemolyticus]|jgi:hypothetical protein|uniref:stability protein StbD n=1 Tax=Haemophilus haemolyticus TaxID=726 RepID=UPI000DAEEDF8|nr:stability protein StbD [Haemophilus haemolyticus]RDE67947.1 stability protein StbD [Haemophilus haemolyticus]TPH04549.1 stability protein StbD [Haemophilus haemolyticus]TPH25206.1 stability protein StbD [Haemophilus haemolyticus]
MALHQILADQVASITDLKRNPMGVIQESESGIVAILNRNQPAFYCITPELFSHMKELIKDLELGRMSDDE